MMDVSKMRATIAWLVIFSIGTTALAVYWVSRGGAVSYEAAVPILNKLLGFYGPLLGIWSGFYFSGGKFFQSKIVLPVEIIYFTIAFLGGALLSPTIIILNTDTIDAAMRILNVISGFLTSIVSMCITYFFSKNFR